MHSFSTLMAELATIVRNTCRTPQASPEAPTFELLTNAQPMHLRALAGVRETLESISSQGRSIVAR